MDTSLFFSAHFSNVNSDRSMYIGFRFYYDEGMLYCKFACPVVYQQIFGPMLTTMGAVIAGDDSDVASPATTVYYVIGSDKGLRETIVQYRELMAPLIPSGFTPVRYEYATHRDTLDGIVFTEAQLGHFEVIASLSCPNSEAVRPKWCRAALATGLVTSIRPGNKNGTFVLTLAPHAQADDRRLVAYEALAVPFSQMAHIPPHS